jgi:hypothetical protein
MYDRTEQLPVCGPRSGQSWQMEKASPTNSTPYHFRLWQGGLYFQPAPPAGNTIAFEYSSSFSILKADTTYARRFTADEDQCVLDDEIILLGLKWRWHRAQGMSFKQEFDDFEYRLTNYLSRDNSAPALQLSDGPQSARPGVIVPAGNWNLP